MCGIFLTYFFILARKSAEPEEDIKAMCSQGNGVLRSRELRLLLAHIGKRRNFDLRDVLYVVLCAVQCAVQHECLWRWWLVKYKWDLVPLHASSSEPLPKPHHQILS